MRIKLKPFVAAFVSAVMVVPMLAGCGCQRNDKDKGEVQVIRIGTHAQSEDDPYWVDSITGKSNMDADKQKAAEAALTKVKEECNVEIQFLQYSSDLQQLLLQTVLAGDPYCELAILWGGCQGTILSQNILQPLDDYAEIFTEDPDGQWILPQKTFGSYYLMNRDLLYTNTWPIVYNIDMIEAVPSLKDANGRTIYPSDLYFSGQWTWSRFKDYMGKIKQYYTGKKASTGNEIAAFNTNYTFFGQFALHSVGAGVYDGEAMKFDTEDAIRACEYVDELFAAELVTCSTVSKTSNDSGWLTGSTAFQNGETVFTNCARWRMGAASTILAERGESMGVIPFPYPDGTNPHTDENSTYRHLTPMADSVGLLRGIDAETSYRALEAYKVYKVAFYTSLAGVDTIEEYLKERADDEALAFGIDIFHPEIGDANLDIWVEFGAEPANDFSEACGIMWTWSGILGNSMYGLNGYSKYRTAVQANKQTIYDKMETIGEAVSKSGAIDAVKPSISRTNVIALPNGTDPATINWGDYLSASDNADGEYEIERVVIDSSKIDFDVVGIYENLLEASVADEAGNEQTASFTVMIYDKDNTETPTLKAKDEIPQITLNKDVSEISWGNYVEYAVDADGLDISSNISADTGWLDVTAAGVYQVDIVATDFVGNFVTDTIQVEVK